jgi:hypothetical protein
LDRMNRIIRMRKKQIAAEAAEEMERKYPNK